MAVLEGSLEIFTKTTMNALRKKSLFLTGYLEHLLMNINSVFAIHRTRIIDSAPPSFKLDRFFKIITPVEHQRRGAQMTIQFVNCGLPQIFSHLQSHGFICDKKDPDLLIVAPNPMYNRFHEVYAFVVDLAKILYKHCNIEE